MRLPIQYALTYPERLPSPARRAPPQEWGSLDFATLEPGRYPAYDSVRLAAAAGGNQGTILNAADEVAVAAFLAGAIAFPRIGEVIAGATERWADPAEPGLDAIVGLDAEIRSTLGMELGLGGAA
jgi:1-deoxy-D-xylulose-5-phosphate reductoisomerase